MVSVYVIHGVRMVSVYVGHYFAIPVLDKDVCCLLWCVAEERELHNLYGRTLSYNSVYLLHDSRRGLINASLLREGRVGCVTCTPKK